MEPRLKCNKIILGTESFYFISDVVPCWHKIVSDPSHCHRSTVL